jgi:hypothetical protein
MSIKDNIKEVRKKMLLEVGEPNRPTCDDVSRMGWQPYTMVKTQLSGKHI